MMLTVPTRSVSVQGIANVRVGCRVQITRPAAHGLAEDGGAAAEFRSVRTLNQARPLKRTRTLGELDPSATLAASVRWEVDLFGELQRSNEAALENLLAREERRSTP